MTWDQICADPLLRHLPFKIEQDRFGRVVMSPPPRLKHGWYRGEIFALLRSLLPGWTILCEDGVGTSEGVKVPDVLAITRIRGIGYREDSFFPEAPEICVEVLSHAICPAYPGFIALD